MKLRKPGARASVAGGSAKHKVEEESDLAVESVEAVDQVDQVDRFEVGSQQGNAQEERDPEAESDQQLFADALEDPTLAREVTLPVLIGGEELSSNVEASLKGVLALVDTEEEST